MSVVNRTYARALYEAAEEAGRLAAVRQDIGDFVEATRQVPELAELLRNPQSDRRAKTAAVEVVAGEGDPLVFNFLRLLVEKNRAGQLEDIAGEFERMAAAQEGELTVELTTAFELSDEEARAIVGQIEERSGQSGQVPSRLAVGDSGSLAVDLGPGRGQERRVVPLDTHPWPGRGQQALNRRRSRRLGTSHPDLLMQPWRERVGVEPTTSRGAWRHRF